MTNISALHSRAADALRPIVAAVRTEDLDRATPCTAWTLRDLLEHMIGQDHGFAAATRADVTVDAFAPRPFDQPVDAHAEGLAAVVEAFAAADPTRPVLLAEFENSRFPLPSVVGFHLIDTLVHGWDVAAALGRPVAYDADLVAAGLAQARMIPGGPLREQPGAPFAPVRPEVGDDWDRTLALLGRDPGWHPSSTAAGRPG